MLSVNSYSVEGFINSNSSVGTFILSVNATDGDESSLKYRIESNDATAKTYFQVNKFRISWLFASLTKTESNETKHKICIPFQLTESFSVLYLGSTN